MFPKKPSLVSRLFSQAVSGAVVVGFFLFLKNGYVPISFCVTRCPNFFASECSTSKLRSIHNSNLTEFIKDAPEIQDFYAATESIALIQVLINYLLFRPIHLVLNKK